MALAMSCVGPMVGVAAAAQVRASAPARAAPVAVAARVQPAKACGFNAGVGARGFAMARAAPTSGRRGGFEVVAQAISEVGNQPRAQCRTCATPAPQIARAFFRESSGRHVGWEKP